MSSNQAAIYKAERAEIYKAELKPPPKWDEAAAKKYQGSLLMSKRVFAKDPNDKDDVDVSAYPFLGTFEAPAPGRKKVLKLSTDDDVIIARGDKILRILSQMDPVSFKTVKTLLDKIPDRIKPLSPSSVQTPPGTPVVPKMKLLKPQGPKMIIKQDFDTFQSINLDDYFYSPEGDIISPGDLKALHVGVKAAGMRKLIAINEMENKFVESEKIEYDLRRYLAGLPTQYVNQVRFNKALKAADDTKTETDSITVKSYHKITGVRKEKVETLTLNHKQWLLKGRVYDIAVLNALYPPFDKRFGYELWKIWASRMQKRLDRYMSQYTEPVVTDTANPGPAYPNPSQKIPVKPFRARIIAAQKATPPPPLPSAQAVPVVTVTPIAKATSAVAAAATAVANAQQVVAQTKVIKLNNKVVDVSGVGDTTIDRFANEAGFTLTSNSDLLVLELLHMIRTIKDGNGRRKKIEQTVAYQKARTQKMKDGIKQIDDLNSAADYDKKRLDDLRKRAKTYLANSILRGTFQIELVDANDSSMVLYDGTRDSICTAFATKTEYECDLVKKVIEKGFNDLIQAEEVKYEIGKVIKIAKASTSGKAKLAEITGFTNRTVEFMYCDDLDGKIWGYPLDDATILPATPAECKTAKDDANQVRQQQLKDARDAAEKKRLEAERKKKEAEKKRKEAEKKRIEEAKKKAEEERLEKERIRLEAERKLKEEQEKLRKAEEEKKRLEEQKKKDDLGIELTDGDIFGLDDEFVQLKIGDDVSFIIKTKLNDDDKDEDKFEALREDKTGHLVKYWYIANPKKQYDMVTVTLEGQNYHFNPKIHDGPFLISEHGGTPIADCNDEICNIPIDDKIIQSAIDAVDAIHSLGYVHKDIKAENMCIKDGVVKLIDFGTSKTFKQQRNLVESFLFYPRQKERVTLVEDPSLGTKKAGDYINGAGRGTFSKFTIGKNNPTLDELKTALGGKLLKGSPVYGQVGVPSIQEALENTDVILYGRAKFLEPMWQNNPADLYQGNGFTIISPPFTENPVFGNIDMAERFKLHDKWALTLALMHAGQKQMKPVPDPMPPTLEPSQVLTKLLFNDDDKSWFSQKNIKKGLKARFINGIPDDNDILKLLSLIIKGDPDATDEKALSKKTLQLDLRNIIDENNLLRDLSEAWINGHYNLEKTRDNMYTFVDASAQNSTLEVLDFDIGTKYYGVSSADIRKLFTPLYEAIQPGTSTGTTRKRQSLFDYDSFSDAELEELNTEMEALDDDELENLINQEISDGEFSYNSSSDTGNSNAAYSYNSESDTGRSNVAYDSSSDTGQSNAAYSYNSESEQSAAESYNDNTYDSDSD